MADDSKQDQTPDEQPQPTDVPQQTPAQQASQAFAESAAAAERLHLTTTVPGGKYVVDGQTVNANGEPVADDKKK